MTTDTKAVARWDIGYGGEFNTDPLMYEDADGVFVLHSDHEAEVARLRAEVEGLRNALTPFAEFALVRSAAGSTSPKTGPVYSVHTRLGEAEITAEDFEAAFNAMRASA